MSEVVSPSTRHDPSEEQPAKHPNIKQDAAGVCARLRAWLARRQRIVAMANVVAAALFVAGCIGFYWPRFFTVSVTAFLLGSVLFLLAALSTILLDHGRR
jgi:small neutral amino acid transporter SnatA (MarC family)